MKTQQQNQERMIQDDETRRKLGSLSLNRFLNFSFKHSKVLNKQSNKENSNEKK